MRRDIPLLLSGAASAVATANALRPIARSGPLSMAAFVVGMPTSELPVQAGITQLAVTVALGRHGGVRSRTGQLGAVLTAASCAGLMQLYRAATRVSGQLEDALVASLGADYRHRITEGFAPPPDVRLTRRRILLPDVAARRRYLVARDVAFGPHGRQNTLDVWRRTDLDQDAARPAPVLVQLHGGGWTTGAKEWEGAPLMGHLAERGWVCVAPNYRLSPKASWPDQIVDAKRALAWVKAHVAEYGGDPGFVAITGGSAGGHLAALAALTPRTGEWQPGFEDADTSVAAAIPFYGAYDFLNRYQTGRTDWGSWLEEKVFKTAVASDRTTWDEASPVSQVNPDAPPFFVLHGSNDSVIPVEETRDFVRDLRGVSRRAVVYAELPGAQHAFDVFPSIRAHHAVHAVERFLAVVRSQHVSGS
jgi:acetyl esterase/lipase